MGAHSEDFPWPSHYGDYKYFEANMNNHHLVTSLDYQGDGVYILNRKEGCPLRVFICECYSFGVAEYTEVVEQIGKVDVVIIDSRWCEYTSDAKHYCRELKVGLFKIGEFMGALNRDDYWNYFPDEEKN